MKFLVIGLGSMGKRRIRNLTFLKAGKIIGFDKNPERRKETEEKYGIETFETIESAMKEEPDALIISTPPDKHIEFAMIAAKNNKHFFTEINVPGEGIEELIELTKDKKIVAAPSSTFRFNSLIRKMKDIVDGRKLGKPLSFTYHSGQYLPDWHPWEDYRKYYVSKRETGACREIAVFELSWIRWVFGEIEKVSCMKGKLSDLEADIDDTYHFLFRLKNNMIGHMLIDVIARSPCREFKLLLEKGVIIWDWTKRVLMIFDAEKKTWSEKKEDKVTLESGYIAGEEMYIEEMRNFIDTIKKKSEYEYNFSEELENIKILLAAEKSSDTGHLADIYVSEEDKNRQ